MELPNNDITENINIICPSNHYSSEFFDANKKTLLLFKQNEFFEPIYILTDFKKVTRTLSLKDKKDIPEGIKKVLETIGQSLNEKCGPLPSMPNVYEFKPNIVFDTLIEYIKNKNITIDSQVINFNGKVIGLILSNKEGKGFIPCTPSSVNEKYPIRYMDDEELWSNYQNTKEWLEYISRVTNKKIPCLPKIKVLEDELIVGIITETNQFIKLKDPEQDTFKDNLKIIESGNFVTANQESLSDFDNIDEDRIKYVKKIKLESNFYNVFRNTIRILLGQF